MVAVRLVWFLLHFIWCPEASVEVIYMGHNRFLCAFRGSDSDFVCDRGRPFGTRIMETVHSLGPVPLPVGGGQLPLRERCSTPWVARVQQASNLSI